jgi:hypothetical protein
MITVNVQIRGLDALRANFDKAPGLTLKYLAAATRAALFAVDKQVNEGGIMQFKTPRSRRTGQLVARFGLNKEYKNGGLSGSTGPTVHYAPYVYFGTKRSGPNKYMDRIALAAEPEVHAIFQKAIDTVVEKTARI